MYLQIILDNNENISRIEKLINNIASNFSFKIDLQVISRESAYEMLSKREQLNIMNESLTKHLIVFGAENYLLAFVLLGVSITLTLIDSVLWVWCLEQMAVKKVEHGKRNGKRK